MSGNSAFFTYAAALLLLVSPEGHADDVSQPSELHASPGDAEKEKELNRRLTAGHSQIVNKMVVSQGEKSPFHGLVDPNQLEGLLNQYHVDHGGVDSPRTQQLVSNFLKGIKDKADSSDSADFNAVAIQNHLNLILGVSIRLRGCHEGSGGCGQQESPAVGEPEKVVTPEVEQQQQVKEAEVVEQRLVVKEYIAQTMEEIAPESPAGPQGLAEVNQERSNHAAAVEYFKTAIERGGETSLVRSHKGRSHYEIGDYKNAFADARRALQLDRRNREAFAVYKLTKGRLSPSDMDLKPMSQKMEKAMEREQNSAMEVASKAPPRDMMSPEAYKANVKAKALTSQAVTKVRVDDRDGAKRLLLKAIKTYPKYAAAYANLASLLVQQGQYHEASVLLETGLVARPNAAALWTARAFVNNKQGKFEEGLRDASNSIRYDANNGYGWFQRAYSKAGLGDREASLLDLEEAARRDRQFRPKLKQAREMLPEADPLLLYDAMMAENRAPPKAPEAPRPPWVYLVFGLIAAGLAAVGLKLEPVRDRINTTFRRKRKASKDSEQGFWKGYRIQREIAAGGMGVVYEAIDTRLDRRVAIKCMRDEIKRDVRERERFLSEARLVAKLEHPNIVAIKGIEEDGGDVYLVFEYVEGRTLYEALSDKGTISLSEARDLFKEVCTALEFAHSKKVVHRDLKPANIMITVNGEVKVMDFGIARQAADALEKLALTNTVIGTPPYMSPEQEDGMVGKAGDVFALGVCLYEALSGEQPFVGTPAAQLIKKQKGEFEPLTAVVDGLPPAIDSLLTSTLHPDPLKRLGSAREFYERLAEIAEGASTPPPPAARS